MNFLFGLVLGVLVTIGVAYVHDASTTSPQSKIVNWTAFDSSLQGAKADLSSGVNRLKQIGSDS